MRSNLAGHLSQPIQHWTSGRLLHIKLTFGRTHLNLMDLYGVSAPAESDAVKMAIQRDLAAKVELVHSEAARNGEWVVAMGDMNGVRRRQDRAPRHGQEDGQGMQPGPGVGAGLLYGGVALAEQRLQRHARALPND